MYPKRETVRQDYVGRAGTIYNKPKKIEKREHSTYSAIDYDATNSKNPYTNLPPPFPHHSPISKNHQTAP
jgi:hypothetical protein